MKLVFCPNCYDVIKFGYKTKRYCKCKKSWGEYTDEINAVSGGECIPLGIANSSLNKALANRSNYAPGVEFTAFVIEKNCPTIKVKK